MPVIPGVATKILAVTEDKLDMSFKELEETIRVDPGLSAKILKVANSALYARQREVKQLQMAITLLGLRTIKSLVLLITASNMFATGKNSSFYKFFWRQSVSNAFMASNIAVRTGNRTAADDCFMAGLLHDIGQVALHNSEPEKYEQVYEISKIERKRISEIEQELFGANHKDVGAAVLRQWNLPDVFVDSALEHGSANVTSPHKQIILTVSIADFITSNLSLYTEPLPYDLIRDILRQTSLTDDDLRYYEHEFMDELQQDKLCQECTSLFGL